MTNNISELKKDKVKKCDFIDKYTDFILSSAASTAKRYISRDDDFFSVALIAFNEAIESYDENRGNFFSYANLVIRSRITDEMRKNINNEIPMSALIKTNDNGETEEFDMIGKGEIVSDIAVELAILKDELEKFDINLFDVSKQMPKSQKTKSAINKVIKFILNNNECQKVILTKNELPLILIATNTGVHKKTLERHRKYIIASTVILSHDYPLISEYIPIAREVH